MPNVALGVRRGVLGVVETEGLDRTLLQRLFGEMGILSFFPEKQMDGFTALVGSGPAFVLVFLESLIESGILVGLSADRRELMGCSFSKRRPLLSKRKENIPMRLSSQSPQLEGYDCRSSQNSNSMALEALSWKRFTPPTPGARNFEETIPKKPQESGFDPVQIPILEGSRLPL